MVPAQLHRVANLAQAAHSRISPAITASALQERRQKSLPPGRLFALDVVLLLLLLAQCPPRPAQRRANLKKEEKPTETAGLVKHLNLHNI
jgi:hypothetical protein